MLLNSAIISNTLCVPIQRPLLLTLLRCFSVSCKQCSSISTPKVLDEACKDFLPWLEDKCGAEVSSVLSIGKSCYGRTLYASKNIQTGDCLLKVPYNAQLSPENLPSEVTCLFQDEISNVAKVALLILQEERLGQNSQWAPYISCLPLEKDLHSTIFWSDEELQMIRSSALYEETLRQKAQIEKDFWSVRLAVDEFPNKFRGVTLREFRYAYGLVTSRAWESSKGVSLIPFADFLNHDGTSEAYLLSDESKQHSEVIADRNLAPGDEIMIRYGRFSNATLLLDFGFSVTCNKYDQVRLALRVPQHDRLYARKLELLDRLHTRSIKDVNELATSGNSFMIKEVQNGSKKGKGIPQPLRAFARILTCNSEEELNALAREAAQDDGRLARSPLKDKSREIAAHLHLLSEINKAIEIHYKSIRLLTATPSYLARKTCHRRKLAQDLLSGELRVLKSASSWLESYCSTLLIN